MHLVALSFVALAAFVGSWWSSPAFGQTSGTPGQEIVFLVTDCVAAGHGQPGTTCFESVAALDAAIWEESQGVLRTASNPLVVDIGPGTFSGSLSCPSGAGYVTFRGAGRERSILQATSGVTFQADDCEELGFQDLTIRAPASGTSAYGIQWEGCGSSSYANMDIVVGGSGHGDSAAWWDEDDGCKAVHYWFGSRLLHEGGSLVSFAIYTKGDEHWFYGGEIKLEGSSATPNGATFGAAYVAATGDLRVYGSLIRALVGDATGVTFATNGVDFVGVIAAGGGTFHMHGGIIVADASASSETVSVKALEASFAGFAHTPDTAFMVRAGGGGGTATRVKAAMGGTAQSPFQWPPATSPPAVASLTGADTFVETDCGDDGDCDGGGSQTHLMIYNPAECPAEKWFNSTVRRCRNDTTP